MSTVEFRPHTMKPLVRSFLRPIVSPRLFQFVRFAWWFIVSYFPRLVMSQFVNRPLQVRRFGASQSACHIGLQLESVNVIAPTKMCRIMTKNGSDKARVHRYTVVYSALFGSRYGQALRVFELGLGTNDPEAPSSMGVFGVPGASLRGWRELFPHALVYGADIDRRILFREERIKTFYCNQLDLSSVRELWSDPELQGGVDIIVEDGLHTFEANVSFLEGSLGNLRPGGIFVIEDILPEHVDNWYHRLETTYSKQYPTHEFAFVVFPYLKNAHDNMLVVRRPLK
jgi:SAM-dependent methyltransferase